MSTTQLVYESAIRIQVSPDRLEAALLIDPIAAPEGVEPQNVLEALQNSGLSIDPDFLAGLTEQESRFKTPGPIVIARGRQPVADIPGRVEILDDLAAGENKTPQNHYQRSHILSADADQPIARIIPTIQGQDGVDVFGKPLPHKAASTRLILGENVYLMPDGCMIAAKVAGTVRFQDAQLWVEPTLTIPGNVDFSTGNIDIKGDVSVQGNIVDLFSARSSGSIRVSGVIEAAEVQAAEDVIVHGGIAARDKGRCRAGNNLSSKYITNATVEAGNNITVQVEVANSRIACGGKLSVERGAILSGHITANGGVTCMDLGSPSNAKTLIEVGIDNDLHAVAGNLFPQIEQQRKKALQIRNTVEPLMRNQKTLTPQQKERATELLYEAAEMEEQANASIQSLKNSFDASQAKTHAEVFVSRTLHSGVTLRFPHVETTIQTPMKGPLRVVSKCIKGDWQIVALDARNCQVVLESHACVDDVTTRLSQFFLLGTSESPENKGGTK